LTVKYLLYYYLYKMYFTISECPPSTPPLSPEAGEAHRRLRQHAVALAGLSERSAEEARASAEAYARALAQGSPESWAAFVAVAAVLVNRSLDADRPLGAEERAARDFFAQIVRENDDLLAADALSLV
jgi:hypothetical protein